VGRPAGTRTRCRHAAAGASESFNNSPASPSDLPCHVLAACLRRWPPRGQRIGACAASACRSGKTPNVPSSADARGPLGIVPTMDRGSQPTVRTAFSAGTAHDPTCALMVDDLRLMSRLLPAIHAGNTSPPRRTHALSHLPPSIL